MKFSSHICTGKSRGFPIYMYKNGLFLITDGKFHVAFMYFGHAATLNISEIILARIEFQTKSFFTASQILLNHYLPLSSLSTVSH